jgi:hypothetical protein
VLTTRKLKKNPEISKRERHVPCIITVFLAGTGGVIGLGRGLMKGGWGGMMRKGRTATFPTVGKLM